MTWTARVMSAWPALHLLAVIGALCAAVTGPALMLLSVPAAVYLLPLAVFRGHQRAWPLRDGAARLLGSAYVPWWGAFQAQWWFVSVPWLEAPLMAVPGLYAAWLRAWGSTVGAHVHFSPGMVVFDRSLLRIGDRVTFGFGVRVSAHVVKPTAGGADLLLVVRRVVIGDGAFIGAGAALGPGATIQPGALVAPGEVVFGGAHRGGGA